MKSRDNRASNFHEVYLYEKVLFMFVLYKSWNEVLIFETAFYTIPTVKSYFVLLTRMFKSLFVFSTCYFKDDLSHDENVHAVM